MKRASVCLAASLSLLCMQAMAEGRSVNIIDDRHVMAGEEDVAIAARDESASTHWRFALGAGGLTAPVYPGADSNSASLVPIILARRGAFFAGITGIGYDLVKNPQWTLTASLTPSLGRKDSDDALLEGLGDIDATVRAKVQAQWTTGIVQVRASLASDIAGNHQGTLGRVDVQAKLPLSPTTVLFAGPGVTWADGRHTRTYFGVTAAQSAASGLPQYDAGSGVNSAHLEAGVLQRFGSKWLGIASLTAARLRGDAADSPVTTDTTQIQFFAGAVYIFQK